MRSFPDDFGSGTGKRVAYDLQRILAVAAVFEFNRLLVPQGHAADITSMAWPEICRSTINAAARAGVARSPRTMPSDATSYFYLCPDAFGDGGVLAATTFTIGDDRIDPAIRVDHSRLVTLLSEAAEHNGASGALRMAFEELDGRFGWTAPRPVVKVDLVGSFMSDGPYVARARALLTAPEEDFDADSRPEAFQRLRWLLDYLEDPAPVDVWIAEAGTASDEPRIRHLIHFWARENGLRPARSCCRRWGSTSGRT